MIAVVVPTVRPEVFKVFLKVWEDLFEKHKVELVAVCDGDDPLLVHKSKLPLSSVSELPDLIYNKNDGVRNFGFWYVAKYLRDVEYIITLDDDVAPMGDPIADHISILEKRVTTSWISTINNQYPRGFPYGIREEAEVVLSHGVWEGVTDLDAPTQLVEGVKKPDFYVGPIPKGIYYPMCGMNIAFKRKMLPYMYYAPMGHRVGLDRFADIWLGITSKRVIDEKGLAVYTGGSTVHHKRASDVYKNLQKEAKGIELNEGFWKGIEDDPYFKLYERQRTKWHSLLSPLI